MSGCSPKKVVFFCFYVILIKYAAWENKLFPAAGSFSPRRTPRKMTEKDVPYERKGKR